jgi:hypothetical protein
VCRRIKTSRRGDIGLRPGRPKKSSTGPKTSDFGITWRIGPAPPTIHDIGRHTEPLSKLEGCWRLALPPGRRVVERLVKKSTGLVFIVPALPSIKRATQDDSSIDLAENGISSGRMHLISDRMHLIKEVAGRRGALLDDHIDFGRLGDQRG